MSLELSDKRILMTGDAGLVSLHLAIRLSEDNYVVIADDSSKEGHEQVPDDVKFVQADMTDSDDVTEAVTEDLDIVFHLAACMDTNCSNPRQPFEENTEMTYDVLERMQKTGVSNIVFTSSSTIYGEAPRPAPEDYTLLGPTSVYGPSRLADEGLFSTFAHSYGFAVHMYRFTNIVGPNQRGNVIPDFIERPLKDPETLEIPGGGRQERSCLRVEDCIDAMCHVVEHAGRDCNVYNLGTQTTTSMTTIVNVVADVLNLDPEFEYTGDDRGWTGDVPKMRLSIEKLPAFGWEPGGSSDEVARRAAEELATEPRAEYKRRLPTLIAATDTDTDNRG